ncbi:hypothetical protein Moror_17154 [Moniliophthora roreri MCA 2997]|uniref:Uncharacterized protein n=2 Tax=Moniliophthora roreri TaxID=221103 RepID=V2X7K3_MONRO|nr:hypothetical protein Moror_17154 [Moniliophthora roreri MCA 2997]KAI3602746.1 hypothetical protein WG66_008110 [Moniliophthora roreri]
MLSLQDISTSNNPDVELESFPLVSRDDCWAAMEFTHFEWAFGLEYHGLPFDSEFNMVTASKDIISCLENRTLRLAPNKEVIQHAYELLQHNHTSQVDERRRFREFGEGPWEYVLFPGSFDHKTLKPKYLPPLFQRSPNGKMEPLIFNSHDYDTLPRITAMIHPTIALLLIVLVPLDPYHAPEGLKENALLPSTRIVGAWPLWSHNRFKPEPTSPKRKRSRSESEITCKCTLCAQTSSFESSSSSGTYASDLDSSDDGERVSLPVGGDPEEDGKVELDVAAWAGKIVLPLTHSGVDDLDDLEDDPLLRTYAQESALAPEQVRKVLKEEDKKRNVLAKPTLEELRCRLSKRSRRS